ncbi:hypothetical protein GQR58_030002 [Nymphon striatum]|nr:hypothetical protein GQR58_030002 [Nymphon striatum]
MKTIIATVIALSVTAPAFAGQVTDAAAHFAADNNSAAERIVPNTSTGDVYKAQLAGALANDSAADSNVDLTAGQATRANTDLLSFFALGNDSAAERFPTLHLDDVYKAQLAGALANDSAADSKVDLTAGQATRANTNLLSFFALGNDSAAERVNY